MKKVTEQKRNLTLTIKLQNGKIVSVPKKYLMKAKDYVNSLCRHYPGEYIITDETGETLYHVDSAILMNLFSVPNDGGK